MKTIFTIVLITISYKLIIAQNTIIPLERFPLDSVWQGWEKPVTKEEKQLIISKLLSETPKDNFRLDDTEYLSNHIKIIDFDIDGLNDAVYYGISGGEPDMVIFFKNNKGEYKEILKIMGGPTKLSSPAPLQALSFSHLQYGCCADMSDHYYEYVPIINNNGDFEFIISKKIALYNGTAFPQKNEMLKTPIAFKVINDEYTLRSSPMINDTFTDGPNFINIGNVIAYYKKGTTGTALAEKKDSTGRVWWFVQIDAHIRADKTELFETSWEYVEVCIRDRVPAIPCYTLGWMSSRYLQKIE